MSKFNRDCCDAVAGNTRAGKVLHKLVFFLNSSKAPVFDGHRWVAFTREKWAEKTGLTIDQVKRILMHLLAAELIIREQHKYYGKVPNFIRLSQKGIDALCAALAAQKCATQVTQNCATLLVKSKNIIEEDKQSANGSAVANSETICLPGKSGYHQEVGNAIQFPNGQGGPDMTGAEMKAKLDAEFAAAKLKSIDTLKPDKVASLVHVWQSSIKEGQVGPGFTIKELGQLKNLINKWPPGQAPAILQFVLSHWYEMTDAVETQTTKYNSPSLPEIGYLLKYQHIAANLFLKSKMKPTSSPKPAKPAPKPVVQPIAQPVADEDKPMTWEELQAMEAAELKAAS